MEESMPIKTILVALALDNDSVNVARRALQLADQHKAKIIGVHVIESSVFQDPEIPSSLNKTELTGMLEAQSRQQLHSLLTTQNEPTILHIESGKAHTVIKNLAASHNADLIVLGPGEAKGLREKMFGSTTDHIVRHASCPVLVVRKNARTPYQHIAIGVDFSDHANAAVLWASRLSPIAARDLIHAFEIPLQFEQAMRKAGTAQVEIDNYRKARIDTIRQEIIQTYGKNNRLPRRTRTFIAPGDPATALLEISRRRAADLIALGTQGKSPIAQHLLGSVARRMLNEAECDVLVVSANAKLEL